MQQDLLLQRDELAQAHQLGEFQKEYSIRLGKQIAIYGVVVFICFIISIATLARLGILALIGSIVLTVLIGGAFGGVLYYYRRLHVYVYTGGLIYLNGNKRRAVRWEQITRVSDLFRGSFSIDVKDEPRIGFGALIDQIGELHSTIEGEIDNPRRSGQERERREVLSMHCRYCNAELMAGAVFCGECGRPVAAGTAEVSSDEDHFDDQAAPANGPSVTPADSGQPPFAGLQQPTPSPGEPFDPGSQVPVYPGPQPGSAGGSHMQQDLFLLRDELAQAQQLGELRKDYTIPFGKLVKNLLVFVFIGFVPLLTTFGKIPIILPIIFAIFYIWVIGSVLGRLIYYSYRRLHVYVYTGGLLYMDRNKRQAVRWEQINNVYRGRGGAVHIDWGGPTEPKLRLTSLIDGIGGLYYTIKREQGTMPASQVSVQPPYAVAPQLPTRWGLWIILGTIGALVLIAGLVLFVVKVSVNSPKPTSTLNAFCDALKSGDYQTAYNQFSSGVQSQIAEAQFAAAYVDASSLGLGKITNCTVSNVNDAAGSGTISITFASGNTVVYDDTFVNQSGPWKINSQQPRSSPTLTLIFFCSALESGNLPAAYNQLSSGRQSQQTEAQFASLWTSTVNSCMVSNINDTAGTGSINFTFANGGSNIRDYTLIDENGNWKIVSGQLRQP